MSNNKKMLEDWNKKISCYKKININEAKKIYLELCNTDSYKTKDKLREELILSTLYIVCDFINNSGLVYLNSYSYDMSDIISVCNGIWISKLDSGVLNKVNSFKEIFDLDFYNKIIDGLNITKYDIGENFILDAKSFIDLLYFYIKQKEKNINFNYNKLIECMKNNPKYQNILNRICYHGYNIDFCELFNTIINSFELSDEDLKISKTKLSKLKYIIISNGIEYLREDIDKIACGDITDVWIDNICKNKINDIIFNSERLNDAQKDIIMKRYGFLDGKCRSLRKIASDYNLTVSRIRQKEAKTLSLLRHSSFLKRIKDLI